MYEWTGEKVNAEIGLVDVGVDGGGLTWGSGRGSGVQTKLSRLELVVGSRRPSCCFDCSTLRDVKVKCMIMIHDIVNVEDAFEDRIDTKVILSRPGVDRDGLDGGHGGDPDCFALFRATLKHWHIWLFRSGKPQKGTFWSRPKDLDI